ncbi:DNA/RNA nuclease SfsA [Effusibacillus lacus]|uniref:Sugar fermentation stimulation protein homolog n=1 Tax=Effusibacillus lacus TaxID=1348429 RepID=A0A292YIV6_9BACL|nr:DNA/RNA nuclease SfsA [Effusibacillus lacus]TCS75123.1 sugar fermentation stimulation protein A [Effusibacillus lacus]GAX89076.1 sugar fermentation stimulation protein SfsA [Effusibacillus lacus]
MKYHHVITGKFIKRVNRFLAHVWLEGAEQIVHVKNTGRLKELLIPGAEVLLEQSGNPERKTPFSLIGVYKGETLVNIDSQVPNPVVYEALTTGAVREIGPAEHVRKEVKYGNSRFDLYYETKSKKGFIEVKGVTLEKEGVALFPDAPTVRGTRHIYEMMEAVENGYQGTILFLIQMIGVHCFTPHSEMDPEFANALRVASQRGVQLLAYDSIVTTNDIVIGKPVEVRL